MSLALQQDFPDPHVRDSLTFGRMYHQSKGIRLLREQFQSLPERPVPESLIISILRLGIIADAEQGITLPECHPRSPLATAQYSHLFGRLSIVPTYAKALRCLIERIGGIQALKSVALPVWLIM